ncbi:MAG: hypothetical protein IJK15_01620 [Bacteroidaceae bacterium]|nr:hypothetical protein [Bacteroidaceae bacterium]
MKKSVYTLLMSCLLCLSVFAMYDGPIKVLRIFNGGVGTTIQLSNVDSLMHSRYDADSIRQSDYLQSVIYSLDSIYNIPTASIDSIVVEDLDVEEYQNNINSIEEYIGQQEELAVEPFQNNLLAWLNAQEWVDHAVINDNRDFITVTMNNGIETFVFFQDMSFFEDEEEKEEQNARIMAPRKETDNKFFDVSHQTDEKLILSPNVLFAQCVQMYPNPYKDWWSSNAEEEKDAISANANNSPVCLKLDLERKNIRFLSFDWKEYGMMLVTQTHGIGYNGGFMVEDESALEHINSRLLILYCSKGWIYKKMEKEVYHVKGFLVNNKLRNSNAVYVGNYCFSYGLAKINHHNAIYGNINRSGYGYNLKVLTRLTEDMFNGYTLAGAHADILECDFFKNFFNPKPSVNEASKRRYFSIKTEDVTDFAKNGNAIIKGKINGYENLKTDVKYYVYVFGKGKELNYADIETGKAFAPNADGTFSYECTDLPETEDNEYQVVIGFTYADKTYYGEVKTFKIEDDHPFCPDGNHPHMIDLGLPSGTKWACCNVGASMPEGYGGYYAWGETSEKSVYDWSTYKYCNGHIDKLTKYCGFSSLGDNGFTDDLTELLPEDDAATVNWDGGWRIPSREQVYELSNREYTTEERTTLNGIIGLRITSKSNGACLFLPAAGQRNGTIFYGVGLHGYYWSRSIGLATMTNAWILFYNQYNHGAFDASTSGRYDGNSVRPVHVPELSPSAK